MTRSSSPARPASGSSQSCGGSRPAGYRRLDALGLLAPLGGAIDDRLDRWDSPDYRLVAVFGDGLRALPVSNELRRFAAALGRAERPDGDPRSIHRFRRATEPWSLEALAFLGATDLAARSRKPVRAEPAEPLLRGDELDLPPGPGDRTPARADRGGAGRRYDRHEEGGARLCQTQLGSGSQRRLSASRRCRTHEPRSSRRRCVRFVAPAGDERALDSGSGAGALAFALAPHVREVVARRPRARAAGAGAQAGRSGPERQLRGGRRDQPPVRAVLIRPRRLPPDAPSSRAARARGGGAGAGHEARAAGCSSSTRWRRSTRLRPPS